ncbi:hypothetical protein KXQ82_17825 [Mucilaginibacter sp. HMF5004]|uniref:hypothetical protein n=1 Tax=Mucilaginibacter rivuli TaxID=2857527 RepID=UPI001C5EB3A0|nr:hypothetical protein [Mucilaginibacter rivuli]MBW4891590.1 hypothetical protein [Mucilaginibacter rivuli]
MYIDLSTLNEGITQDKRRLQALAPDFIDIDERDTDELLKLMTQFSAQFNYYNESNTIAGNWEDFFKSDVRVLLVLITKFNMFAYIDQFSAFENKLFTAKSDKALCMALKDLFNFVMDALNMLNDLRNRLVLAADGSKIIDDVNSVVKSFNLESLKLIEYNKEATAKFKQDFKISYPEYLSRLKLEETPADIFDNGQSTNERILNALPAIKAIFLDLGTKFNGLLGVATFYYKNRDLLSKKDGQSSGEADPFGQYQPHMALCIAFLELYSALQKRLNLTTKKHLDLYYKRILGLELKQPVPDEVHVVFEKDDASPDVSLLAGEELLAKVPDSIEQAVFALTKPTLITAAQIAELKTLVLATHEQIRNEFGIVSEVEVYDGAYPFISAAAYLKSKIPTKTWPVFGEDQELLADVDRTMRMSTLGVLISSPVLYQPEGRRTILFSIYLDDASYEGLMDYFTNYSKVNKKDTMAVSHQLLSDAFIINYTDTKGWKRIEKYSAFLDVAERKLDIEIHINNSDEFIDVYNPIVHGEDYDTEWPIFRLLLNTYSVNNPFTYLRKVKMQRITIIADVRGSRAVKLQNSVGPVSAVSTSQIFGPMPSVGSYIDIKSSNIFNKYTKTFCIRLDWVDLPKEVGGWETYYRAYNNKVTNKSFQIKLSTLNDGKFVPKLIQQQQMALFESDDDGTLKNTTQLQDIDMKRLFFNKKPLLDKQDIVSDKNFTEGALRLELVAPKDAFGHRLFAQIFPEVVVYNAKHSKKLELPNQPYIPSIRSLSIDYVLEDSEVLVVKDKKAADNDLKLFHIYPFGHVQLYPGKTQAPYSLIPDFDQNNNLFIGLTGVKPGQVLSMLFQLDEKNFSKLAETKTQWSYLDNNDWVDFAEEDVLYDATNNFINTGIIEIRLPDGFKTGNTILSSGLYWLRASSKNNIKSSIRGIYTQAARATRIVSDTSSVLNLPQGSVKIFKRKILGIQSITQPFPSFGGKTAETDVQYYTRVSERLRHGQRLLTNRDIELSILQQFPEIFMAKCIDPKQYSQEYIEKYRPGLRVILVPLEQTNGLFTTERPGVNLDVRYRVNKFLERSTPSFLNIQVKSPVYETIKVICAVKFKYDGGITDTGMNMGKLNDDIKRFLCPWLFEQGAEFKIGSGIYMVELLNFIRNLPYITEISDFSLAHFYFDEEIDSEGIKARVNYSYKDNVYIKGSLPQSVLVPNKNHLITLIGTNDNSDTKKIGISEFAIMDELLVDEDDSVDVIMEAEPTHDIKADNDLDFFDLVVSHNLD